MFDGVTFPDAAVAADTAASVPVVVFVFVTIRRSDLLLFSRSFWGHYFTSCSRINCPTFFYILMAFLNRAIFCRLSPINAKAWRVRKPC